MGGRLVDSVNTDIMPSPALISRGRLVIDGAYMRYMRDVHEEFVNKGGVLFGGVDSSPQGLANWLISEYFMIKEEDLDRLFEMADFMQRRAQQGGLLMEEEIDDFKEFTLYIKDHVYHHVNPTGALGARRANYDHKAHTWMHEHRLEQWSWELASRFVALYFAFAIDRGPEKDISIIDVDPTQVFPYWSQEGPSRKEGPSMTKWLDDLEALDAEAENPDNPVSSNTRFKTTHSLDLPNTDLYVNCM